MNQRLIYIRSGKGGKERAIPVSNVLYDVLADYLEPRPDVALDQLFITRDKRPLGRTGLTALFQRALRNSGIQKKGITMHKLRHTFATMLLHSGCHIVTIQRLLGHSSLETTAIYMHSDVNTMKTAVEKLPLFGN